MREATDFIISVLVDRKHVPTEDIVGKRRKNLLTLYQLAQRIDLGVLNVVEQCEIQAEPGNIGCLRIALDSEDRLFE